MAYANIETEIHLCDEGMISEVTKDRNSDLCRKLVDPD